MNNSEQVKILADRLLATQPVKDVEQANRLATKILSTDEDIAQAAIEWSATGVMPAVPEIAGKTPLSLSDEWHPSQVFGWLAALREDQESAEMMMVGFHGPRK